MNLYDPRTDTILIVAGVCLFVLAVTGLVICLGSRMPRSFRRGSHQFHAGRGRAMTVPEAPNTPSLYSRVGHELIVTLVDRLYNVILADNRLAYRFRDIGVEGLAKIKRHQVDIVVQILGGPKRFTPAQLHAIHGHLNLSYSEHFLVMAHLFMIIAKHPVSISDDPQTQLLVRDVVMAICGAFWDLRDIITVRDLTPPPMAVQTGAVPL